MTGLTIRRFTNLATPQRETGRRGDAGTRRRGDAEKDPRIFVSVSPRLSFSVSFLEATKGLEPLSTGLQDRRLIQLSYIARSKDEGGRMKDEGIVQGPMSKVQGRYK
jgi:hypothetical protein